MTLNTDVRFSLGAVQAGALFSTAAMDTAQTCLIATVSWQYLIQNFVNPDITDHIFRTVAALLTFTVNSFFAHRVHRSLAFVSTTEMYEPKIISAVSVLMNLLKVPPRKLQQVWRTIWAAQPVFTTDIIITAGLCYYLRSMSRGMYNTKKMLGTLVSFADNNGALTCASARSIVALASLICWLTMPYNLVYLGFHFTIGKFYSNSLLATLNMRDHVKRTGAAPSGLMDITTPQLHDISMTSHRGRSRWGETGFDTSPYDEEDQVGSIMSKPAAAHVGGNGDIYASPFEGPEKLLEIWFAPSPAHLPGAHTAPDGKFGLRTVARAMWEDMLAIVKCEVLSVVEGAETDAYLLSESSLFVSPHRLILKTCGTTLNLLGLPRILAIARDHASLPTVYRCFYSRKSFFFPERQKGPHREWKDEVGYLDGIFQNGAAYSVGRMNGDHWLLYITGPSADSLSTPGTPVISSQPLPESGEVQIGTTARDDTALGIDYTIEILMTHLPSETSEAFVFGDASTSDDMTPSQRALELSSAIGIADLFPAHLTTLDAYAFTPCGYSSNALLEWGESSQHLDSGARREPGSGGEGYYTIHVTPEQGWSYASFECNVPLSSTPDPQPRHIPDLKTLVRRVVDIFRPGKLSLTLFISSASNDEAEEEEGETAVEAAQRAFKAALTSAGAGSAAESARLPCIYKRTDKINYEFGDYDLAFASFELKA
ncbi:S-adenosylmethionine decarboxylase [Auriscalpium vulgare]|uniref:S-adenosylmethionine decarboxylase n=1 Tax=Auriscalpium vulgare TaxID=40419 RepID=A0ACB8RWC8_9AGAM|nr:S-adenosylmethionine decarboxylase [Auriscalpium vulgare]